MPGLPNQIDNGSVAFALLKMRKLQLCRLFTAQPATQEEAEERSVSFALEGIRARYLPEGFCLIGGEPVTKANAEVLRPSDPPDASGEIRAEQAAISSFVCEAPDRREPPVNRARRKLT